MGLKLQTAPTIEPIALSAAVDYLRRVDETEHAYVNSLIVAARQWCEVYVRRSFINTTWKQTLSGWPSNGIIALDRPPLVSVTSISYVDSAGDSQTLSSSDYTVDIDNEPGRVLRGYNVTLPLLRQQGIAAPVSVVYVAGYGATAASVPQAIKQAILLMVGQWFEHREPVVVGTITADVPMTATSLLDSYRWGFYP